MESYRGIVDIVLGVIGLDNSGILGVNMTNWFWALWCRVFHVKHWMATMMYVPGPPAKIYFGCYCSKCNIAHIFQSVTDDEGPDEGGGQEPVDGAPLNGYQPHHENGEGVPAASFRRDDCVR